MDENSKVDELAEAAELEAGDAKKAWRLLAAGIDATDHPAWVKQYVARSAAVVEAFDMRAGDQAALAHDLGFYREEERQGFGYDLDHIFEWFTKRMMRDVENGLKINISRTSREYHEEVSGPNSKPNSVKKAYEKVRERIARQREAEIALNKLLSEL